MNKELSGMVKALGKPKTTKKKRTHSIYTPVPADHLDGDNDFHAPGEVYAVDKVFKNGDSYTGQWMDGCPSVNGKYSWADGCMYVGGWMKGKSSGKGKFSWPNGATYEGRFKNGYINGEGTYIGSNGDNYRGAWLFDMKHGVGNMSFANGDHYEGEWDRNRQAGQGSYKWKNGNEYIGKWRKGKMNGNGIMTWANGNVYDGCWKDGLPKGNGTFRWAEGSFYVGEWSENPEEQNGTYYPSSFDAENFDWDPQEVYKVDLKDCGIGLAETIMINPSEKIVNGPCEGKSQNEGMVKARLRRASMDEGLIARDRRRSDSESDAGSDTCNEGYRRSVGERKSYNFSTPEEFKQPHIVIQTPRRKQGVAILKGHKNYEFTCDLQLGIRHYIGKSASAADVDLKATPSYTKEKRWTKFPTEGSKRTPPHEFSEFKWKDYCPMAFRMLRKSFQVDEAEYMHSICESGALREISSPSKGGNFIYLTNDDKYIIKTMKKAEVKALLKMIPAYYNHVRAFENTLLSKFYGLHCVKFTGNAQKKVRFVIMGNLFCSDVIHRCFDLKGSSHGRLAVKPESKIDSTTTLKDVDLNFIFKLRRSLFQDFSRQLDRDCNFLEEGGIMGYSLLLGIHFRQVSQTGVPITLEAHDKANGALTSEEATSRANLVSDQNRGRSMKLGINTPARAELIRRVDREYESVRNPSGMSYDVILHFGIIDILQDYDINKKLEHAYKSFQYDPTLISSVSPKQYSRRFREFILGAITEET